MSIKRIIMITGSKGGGGKTPVAVSIALTLQELGIPTLACDFNFNNHDLFTILHGMDLLERKRNNRLEEFIFDNDPYWKIKDKFWLTRWHSTMDLGLPSTEQMWDKIKTMTKVDFPPDSEPEIMVFDTNLTLPLICPPMTKIQNYPDLPPIEVWHLWSPSIVLQVDEQSRFVKAIDLLKRFNPGFENRMTHIFTPRHYQTSGLFGTFASLARGEFNITKDVNYKQSKPKPITFNEIKDVLFADFLPEILNLRKSEDLDIKELLEIWLKNIIEQLEKREYKTNNVILVPTVVHNIALLVEELTLKPRRTLETAREDLGSLYDIIKAHFKEHRNDLLELV